MDITTLWKSQQLSKCGLYLIMYLTFIDSNLTIGKELRKINHNMCKNSTLLHMSSIRKMASTLSKEQFLCAICLDIFKNPVSLACGHNFCQECIKCFWDTGHKPTCPLCKEAFKNQPELRINVGLKDITEQFKRSVDAVHFVCTFV